MTNSEEKFPCTMCGACCANVGRVVKVTKITGKDLGYDFPINDDGSCGHRISMLTPEGRKTYGCEIYKTRPDICNVELTMPKEANRQEHFRASMMACNLMQLEQNIDESYRVQVDRPDKPTTI